MATPQNHPAVIKVVGVDGGGANAVNRMIEVSLKGVGFIVANIGMQALLMSDVETKSDIGCELMYSLGADANPAVGRKAAKGHIDEIIAALEGADMVFVAAGEGDGTGIDATPVVAKITRDAGVLMVGVMTCPFSLKDNCRVVQTEGGVAALREEVDTLIVILSDCLLEISDASTSVLDVFRAADQVLLPGVQNITELITTPGLVNVDFNDAKSVMKNAGSALMGIGVATGKGRALRAIGSIISSLLLGTLIDGAHGVLMFFQGGSDLSLQEVCSSSQLVREAAHPEANIIFGNVTDDALGDEARVTVITIGFDEATDVVLPHPSIARTPAPVAQQRPVAPEAKVPTIGTTCITQLSTCRLQRRADVTAPACVAVPAPVETSTAAEYEESEPEYSFEIPRVYPEVPKKEELDIPPFLR